MEAASRAVALPRWAAARTIRTAAVVPLRQLVAVAWGPHTAPVASSGLMPLREPVLAAVVLPTGVHRRRAVVHSGAEGTMVPTMRVGQAHGAHAARAPTVHASHPARSAPAWHRRAGLEPGCDARA